MRDAPIYGLFESCDEAFFMSKSLAPKKLTADYLRLLPPPLRVLIPMALNEAC